MAECGGWMVTVDDDGRIRLFMVANRDLETANKLAISFADGGTVVNSTEISVNAIGTANMQADEVRESADLTQKG
jgi:hypothetical protein